MDAITTHSDDAVARLVEQYRDKTGMVALVRAFGDRAQVVEDTLQDLLTLRWAATATGAVLDNLGAVVGEPRRFADDEVYRLYVLARIRANRSSGTVEDLIAVLRLVVAVGVTVEVDETAPAGFRVNLAGEAITSAEAAVFADLVGDARAAGVSGSVVWIESTHARRFLLDTGGSAYPAWQASHVYTFGDRISWYDHVFEFGSLASSGTNAVEPDWGSAPNPPDEVEEDPLGLEGGPWVWTHITPPASGDGYDHGLGDTDFATSGGRLWGVLNT